MKYKPYVSTVKSQARAAKKKEKKENKTSDTK